MASDLIGDVKTLSRQHLIAKRDLMNAEICRTYRYYESLVKELEEINNLIEEKIK